MATSKQFNAKIQVKELNGKRWVCQIVDDFTQEPKSEDFIDNSDGKLWRKIRPYRANDTLRVGDDYIAGTSQELDDK